MTATHYFIADHYSSTRDGVVPIVLDPCHKGADGYMVGIYSRARLADLRERHPSARVVKAETYWSLHDKAWATPPVRITEEQFNDARDMLPPDNWRRLGRVEVFTMSEKLSGDMTRVYARVEDVYFRFIGRYDLPIQEILNQIGATLHQPETQV